MSDTTNRETQFASFAEMLLKELYATGAIDSTETDLSGEEVEQKLKAIIAQRAYDLAVHVASFMTEPELRRMWAGMLSPGQVVQQIPDMIEWPGEE